MRFSRFQINGRVDVNRRKTWYVYSEWANQIELPVFSKDLQIFRVALSRKGQWEVFTIHRFTSINAQNSLLVILEWKLAKRKLY